MLISKYNNETVYFLPLLFFFDSENSICYFFTLQITDYSIFKQYVALIKEGNANSFIYKHININSKYIYIFDLDDFYKITNKGMVCDYFAKQTSTIPIVSAFFDLYKLICKNDKK